MYRYKDKLKQNYFVWLYNKVCHPTWKNISISWGKTFGVLFDTEFTYTIPFDAHRAEDGLQLRYFFAMDRYYKDSDPNIGDYPGENEFVEAHKIKGPCSILEMMIALASRCEGLVGMAEYGDRTVWWFWRMVKSLGLNGMTDSFFDSEKINFIVQRFLNREYEPNGKGGLFTLDNPKEDMRELEIWMQMQRWAEEEVNLELLLDQMGKGEFDD